MNVTSGIITLC